MMLTIAGRRLPFWVLLPLIAFVALAILLLIGLGKNPREVPSPLIGKPIPAFQLPDLRDPARQVSDADLRGRITLLNVWASWCPACRAEHGMLMALSEQEGFQIIGLNWKDASADARQVLRQTGDPYRLIAFDPDNQVGIDWGVYGAPETFVIDRQGIIRYKHIGAIDQSVWERTLAPLIERLTTEP